jgi:hypothetical protein
VRADDVAVVSADEHPALGVEQRVEHVLRAVVLSTNRGLVLC